MEKPKKIGRGQVGTVFSPNFPCPEFPTTNQYLSKLMWKSKPYEREIEHMDKIKQLDPNQIFLSTYDDTCETDQRIPKDKHEYKYNIIKKYYGVSLNKDGYNDNRSFKHIKNIFLKQILLSLLILHTNGIFHGDIGHRNIVYDSSSNRYRLIDFNGSLTIPEINKTCTKQHLQKAEKDENLVSVFDAIAFRGDSGHSNFKFSQWKDVHDMMYDKKHDLKGFDFKNLAENITKEHEHLDVMYVLHIAICISKNKSVETKIFNMIQDILVNKYVKTMDVWNVIFPDINLPNKFVAEDVKYLIE